MENNKLNIDTVDLRHEKRLSILADELVKMKSRRQIIDEYTKKWNMPRSTINVLLQETYVWLATNDNIDREQIKKLNSARLDELFGEAKSLSDKLKIINMINKTYSVYDNNVNLSNKDGDEFKFDVGV